MTKKDGYQDYLDTSARTYNAVGAAHHDPAVRARQAMQTGIYPQSAAGGGADVGLGLAAIFISLPIVFPAVAFYQGVVETLVRRPFDRVETGLLFANQILDGILIVALVLAFSYVAARFVGYFLVVGIVSLFCWTIMSPVAAYAFVFAIYLYWVLRWLGTQKFVWSIPISLGATVVAMLAVGELLGSGVLYDISTGYFDNPGVRMVVVYFIFAGMLWALYKTWDWVVGFFGG